MPREQHITAPAQPEALRYLKYTYNTYLVSLRKRLHQLDRSPQVDKSEHEESSIRNPKYEPVYPTLWGNLTFEDIYKHTQRIAGYIFKEVYGMDNPEDIDDCLQAGYFKLWQKLQANQRFLADKPKNYIVKAITLHAKAQRYSHIRHYRKLVYDADPQKYGTRAVEVSRVDTWLDLAQAITIASELCVETADYLGLYVLITQVSMSELVRTFPDSRKKLTNAREHMRTILITQLPDYGRSQQNHKIGIKPIQPTVSVSNLIGITDWQGWRNYPSENRGRVVQIQNKEKEQPPAQRIPTGWRGWVEIDELLQDPQLQRSAFAKGRQLGVPEDDLEDCFQQGLVKLWQNLQENPTLLADKGPVWAGIYTIYSGNTKKAVRHKERVQHFTDPEFDFDTADEHLWLSKQTPNQETSWEVTTDTQLDLTQFMHTMAQLYEHEPEKLIALYAITTSVLIKDIEPLLNIPPRGHFKRLLGNKIQQDMQHIYHTLNKRKV